MSMGFGFEGGASPLYISNPATTRGAGEQHPGLGSWPRSQWPERPVAPNEKAIDRMRPGSPLHQRVREYLLRRLHDSERAMTKFQGRWRSNEMRHQAWLDLKKFDQIVKDSNDSGRPPKAHDIVVPFQFATLSTMSTYMLQVFCGRRPYMQVGTYGPSVNASLNMETVLQYQNDHNSAVGPLWQWYNDMWLYGVGILAPRWEILTGLRTRISEQPIFDLRSGLLQMEGLREQSEVVEYEGNTYTNVDPFMFYPDPRVPMKEVSKRGEYVVWRCFEGKHTLKRLERNGELKWVDDAPESIAHTARGQLLSGRALLSGGDPHPGGPWDWQLISGQGFYKVDTYSIEIVPRELGVGESERVEKWLFVLLNDTQIVKAEKQVNDHDEHPVVVAEPVGMGYAFGSLGMSDYLGPLQDSMGWFLNSHMENVRSSINNQFVVNPNAVEVADLKRPGPGKIIRLKKQGLINDVRQAIQQLPVQDITRGNIDDMQTYFELGQRVSAVSENLLGLQDSGGRKTATEVRTSSEAAASRLAALARVVSAQGMVPLARQMSLNTQQFMSTEFYTRVVGPDGMLHPITIGPDQIVGDFHYPVHDGTLPLDRVAMLDIWKEIYLGVLQDPQLRQTYSVPKIFEFIAELGGAKNIKSFRLQPSDPALIEQQAQAGNLAPLPVGPGPSGLTNGALPAPRQRMTDFSLAA